ncbi:MAG: amine oxidase [Candidatus Xenobia bacterium]
MKFYAVLLGLATCLGLASPLRAQEHPLDPLTQPEIETAVAVLKREGKLDDKARLPTMVLDEPPKAQVLAFKPGDPVPRRAFVVILDRSQSKVYEAVVDVAVGKLVSYKQVPGVQPGILVDEFVFPQDLVRADPRWQAAMKKRGITNFSDVQIDVWAPGILSDAEMAEGRRICRCLSFYRGGATNPYARPIEGVIATVDMNNEKVLEVTDLGVVPVVDHPSDFDEKSNAPLREAPRPLSITQPQGESFTIKGNQISWQNWQFRVGMDPREGLVLHDLRYNDKGKLRPVAYRLSLAEMVVPYGDPAENWTWRNAFDLGEYGVGRLANSLVKGADLPPNAVTRDSVFVDDYGKAYVQPAAYGIYERDAGILWKHFDFDSGHDETRRARELVLGFVATVGNYDYAFWWILGQDGSISVEGELTGIMLAKGVKQATVTDPALEKTGRMVAPHVVAPNHQHFFGYRLDMDIDGTGNSVVELNNQSFSELGQRKNAFGVVPTVLATEKDARRDMNFASARKWNVINPTSVNACATPHGYLLVPKENAIPYMDANNPIRQRARFLDHHLWVTRYVPGELHPAGLYPNQGRGGDGLPRWSGTESIDNQDVVIWYNFGVTHNPRPEEWPVMPHHKTGFTILPNGFFDRNPAMDLPNSAPPPADRPPAGK